MRLVDKLTGKRIIIMLLLTFITIIAVFLGTRFLKNRNHIKEITATKDSFLYSIENSEHQTATELWPIVYTYFSEDTDFLSEFSDTLFTVYSDFYVKSHKNGLESPDAYLICKEFNNFIETNSFDMVVSAVYDDFLNENIDYRTFIGAINDFYLFTLYKSPKVVEILELASVLYESRQSYLLAESSQRLKDYNTAIELYSDVPAVDIIYYPLALQKIEDCIYLLKEQIRNND